MRIDSTGRVGIGQTDMNSYEGHLYTKASVTNLRHIIHNTSGSGLRWELNSASSGSFYIGNPSLNALTITSAGAVTMAGTLGVTGALTGTTATFTTADNTDTLSLISTDADANSGPNLRLYRNSANPADSDLFGQIDFEGRNDNSQDFVATQIKVAAGDVSDGSEDAQIEFDVMTAGTLREYLRLASGSNPAVIINQDGQDINFQVQSDGNANMLFVDGGNDRVGIGTASPSYVLHTKSSDSINTWLQSTHATDCKLQFSSATTDDYSRISDIAGLLKYEADMLLLRVVLGMNG